MSNMNMDVLGIVWQLLQHFPGKLELGINLHWQFSNVNNQHTCRCHEAYIYSWFSSLQVIFEGGIKVHNKYNAAYVGYLYT